MSAGAPVVVPSSLPSGLDATAAPEDFVGTYSVEGREFGGDELAFYLLHIGANPEVPEYKRVVTSTYRSVVLGGSAEELYEVRQWPEGTGRDSQCRQSDSPGIKRSVGGVHLLVCSPALVKGEAAWDYWSNVAFTDRLDTVAWLRGDPSST